MTATATIRDRRYFSVQVPADAADFFDALTFASGRPKGRLLADLIRDAAERDTSVLAVLQARRTPSTTSPTSA
jgi:hypothetical protein